MRAGLIDAVGAVVRRRGLGGVSLRAVAAHVGVTHTAATYHFGDKAGLLTAFATEGYARLAEAVMSAISDAKPADGPGILEAVGRGYVGFALSDPARFEVMFRLELLNPEEPAFVAASEAAYALLVSAVARCRDEGFLGDAHPEVVAVSAWSLVHGLSALWISGRLSKRIEETDPARLAANVSSLFVDRVLRSSRKITDR